MFLKVNFTLMTLIEIFLELGNENVGLEVSLQMDLYKLFSHKMITKFLNFCIALRY